MCRLYDVSRFGYQSWKTRSQFTREARDIELTADIERVFGSVDGVYGSPKIYHALQQEVPLLERIAALRFKASLSSSSLLTLMDTSLALLTKFRACVVPGDSSPLTTESKRNSVRLRTCCKFNLDQCGGDFIADNLTSGCKSSRAGWITIPRFTRGPPAVAVPRSKRDD